MTVCHCRLRFSLCFSSRCSALLPHVALKMPAWRFCYSTSPSVHTTHIWSVLKRHGMISKHHISTYLKHFGEISTRLLLTLALNIRGGPVGVWKFAIFDQCLPIARKQKSTLEREETSRD